MRIKKIVLWSFIKEIEHPSLERMEDLKIANLTPILEELFPGINYYSIHGFNRVMNEYGIPAINKLFPEIKDLEHHQIKKDDVIDINKPFLPSKGYEWQTDPSWKIKFDDLITK